MGRQCSQRRDQYHHQERQGHAGDLRGRRRRIGLAEFCGECATAARWGRMFIFVFMANTLIAAMRAAAPAERTERFMEPGQRRFPRWTPMDLRAIRSPCRGTIMQGNENEEDTGGNAGVAGGNILGRWTHAFSDDSDMSLQVYYDRTHLADPEPGVGFGADGQPDGRFGYLRPGFSASFSSGSRNNIVLGPGLPVPRHDQDNNAPAFEFLPSTLRPKPVQRICAG